jgi:hypothetical protein
LALKYSGGIKSAEYTGLETIYENGKCMKQFDLATQRAAFHNGLHIV